MSTVDMFSILVGVICCVVLEVGGQEASNNSVPQGAPMSPPACPCAKAAWCKPVKIQGKGKPQVSMYGDICTFVSSSYLNFVKEETYVRMCVCVISITMQLYVAFI